MKSDVNDAYQQLLKQLVNTKEQMLDFMYMVEQLEGEPYKMTPERILKFDIINMRTRIYDPMRHFLNDMDVILSSSEIQNHINDLPDDDELEDDEEIEN